MEELTAPNAASVRNLLLDLHQSCRLHIEQATGKTKTEIDEVLSLEADISAWLSALEPHPEFQQLRSAHQDFGLAFYAALSGLYRQAFAGLRSFLEVTVGATYLSAMEFQRRQWVSGKSDISWSSISSPDTGIYSAEFVREFCAEAMGDRTEMLDSLRNSYRRCSEYIHGNVSTSQMLPARIEYSDAVLKEWLEVAARTLRTVLHAFMVRYYKDFNDEQRHGVEASLEDSISHLSSVKSLLGLHVE